jgi:23S rRNA pseudouridine2605 synthase
MAYKKQGNSRDDKSAESNRRTGKPASRSNFSASAKNERPAAEDNFRKKPSAFGAPRKSFGGAKEASTEKRFGRPSEENNRFKSRDNSNASFTGKKSVDDKSFRKSNTEGKPFEKRAFSSSKPSFAPRTDKPFKSRNSEGFKEGGRSAERPYKSSNSDGRP